MPMNLEDAVMLLRNENINVAVEFTQDKYGYLLFNVRGTPWSNSALKGNMVLVAEHDLHDAVILLAESIANRLWTPLNWRVRLDEPGNYVPGKAWTVLRGARSELENIVDEVQGHQRPKDTGQLKPKP